MTTSANSPGTASESASAPAGEDSAEVCTVAITACGLLSPLGDSLEDFFGALCRGEHGFAPVEGFSTEGLEATEAGEIRGFDPLGYLGRVNLRPLDRTGRLATVAAHLALESAGLSREEREARSDEVEIGLVLGTMFGSVHTISAFDRRALEAGPNYAKPLDFANSVINAAAGQTAIWHGLRGVNSTIAGGTAAGVLALASGTEAIRMGRAEVLLVGGAEELCFESLLGFQRAGMLASSGNGASSSVPLHPASSGFRLAEGCCLLLMESLEGARRRGASVLATVAGHGCSFDPSLGRDEASAAAATARAVEIALDDADCPAGEVDLVSLSANGRPAGDRGEALGVARVFGKRSEAVPVMAIKGVLGEALGASGAFQAAALVAAMGQGRLPGIPGLAGGSEILPGAQEETRKVDVGTGLVLALGLDGQVAAVVLRSAA